MTLPDPQTRVLQILDATAHLYRNFGDARRALKEGLLHALFPFCPYGAYLS
jgi:hypothetical protein